VVPSARWHRLAASRTVYQRSTSPGICVITLIGCDRAQSRCQRWRSTHARFRKVAVRADWQTLLNRLQMGGDQWTFQTRRPRLGPTMRSTSSARARSRQHGDARCGADAAEDVEAARTWQHHAQHGRQVRPGIKRKPLARQVLPTPGAWALGFSVRIRPDQESVLRSGQRPMSSPADARASIVLSASSRQTGADRISLGPLVGLGVGGPGNDPGDLEEVRDRPHIVTPEGPAHGDSKDRRDFSGVFTDAPHRVAASHRIRLRRLGRRSNTADTPTRGLVYWRMGQACGERSAARERCVSALVGALLEGEDGGAELGDVDGSDRPSRWP